MRIVYCLPSIHVMGGLERIIILKANYLSRIGYEVCLITTEHEGENAFFELHPAIRCYNLNIDYERNKQRPFVKKMFYFFYNRYLHTRKLRALLNELQADVVISTFRTEMPILPYLKDGSKKVLEFHGSRPMFKISQREGIYRWAEKLSESRFEERIAAYDRFVVLTKAEALEWKNCRNLSVIPNMLPEISFSLADLSAKRVIAAGRYGSEKGFDRLIAAWELIAQQQPDWTLHIYGEGPLRTQFEQQIERLKLNTSVFLEGETKTIEKEYAQSSIFALSSHYEGFGMVLAEAEAAGLPLVSFDVPNGPRSIIHHGENGFLVKDGDIKAYAEALLKLMDDVNLRREMGRRAYEDSRQYLPEVVMKQWTDLFEEMVRTK